MSAPLPLLSGLCGLLLLLLSVAVLTVVIDRLRWWLLWRQRRVRRRSEWAARLSGPGAAARAVLDQTLEDWEREMGWGEPLLQAAAVLAPLTGLLGTVAGLMGVLSRLGPRLELPAGSNLAAYGQVLLTTVAGLLVSLIATAALLSSQALREWQIGRLRRDLRSAGEQRR